MAAADARYLNPTGLMDARRFFSQVVVTCYVQATWIDVSRSFYFERMVGVVFWAVLLALFSYALLRGIADSLTGKMADPSLYGARVTEAWRAWRTKRRSSWRASGAALTARSMLRAQPPWRPMQSARART